MCIIFWNLQSSQVIIAENEQHPLKFLVLIPNTFNTTKHYMIFINILSNRFYRHSSLYRLSCSSIIVYRFFQLSVIIIVFTILFHHFFRHDKVFRRFTSTLINNIIVYVYRVYLWSIDLSIVVTFIVVTFYVVLSGIWYFLSRRTFARI